MITIYSNIEYDEMYSLIEELPEPEEVTYRITEDDDYRITEYEEFRILE